MLILAFDTTSEYGGVGLYCAHTTAQTTPCLDRIASADHPGGRPDYSVWLFEQVEKMLVQSGHTLGQVDLFAVANGPGSFTGIRVGVAAAQGWSQSLDRPVEGVSTLEAMLEAAQPASEFAIALADARRGEI